MNDKDFVYSDFGKDYKQYDNKRRRRIELLVDELLEVKVQMKESDKGKRIDKLNEYIVNMLEYYKDSIAKMEDDRNSDWEALNEVFLNFLLR